ncbi:ankyrin repeat and SOCS box protein 7 [Xylariaceae sp. FL0594]|nr:ankyrin repeat and SOCS box protein 7 [Xylariaceae sp. FL0594]
MCHRFQERRMKAAIQSSKSSVELPVLAIEKQETDVYRLCSLVHNECMGSSLNEIAALIHDNLAQQEKKVEERRLKLAAWINGVDTRNTYENALKYRHEGTCEWVLQLDEMQAWRSEEPQVAKLFWLHGPPGFGKTVTSAWTVHELKKTNPDTTAYFFCVAESRLTQDPYAILRSWLAQLLDQDTKVLSIMESAFAQRTTKNQTLSQLELWQLFVLIGESGTRCTLVVDGFDECTHIDSGINYHTKDPRNQFLRDLTTHLQKTKFRVLVVSRDVADIREYLDPKAATSENLRVTEYAITAEDNEADVRSFSEDMVNRRLPNKDPALRESLTDSAASRSEGMFLWIKLLENEISPGQNARELQETITEMPAGVSEAYSRELDRIMKLPVRAKSTALAILRWVLFAVRPLEVKELAEALALSDLPDDLNSYPRDRLPDVWEESFVDEDYVHEIILARCGSLIQLRARSSDESLASRTVHFVHFSVKEYLLNLTEPYHLIGSSNHIDVTEEETRLANICLRYLGLPIFAESPPNQEAYPFLAYAGWAWYFHSYKRKLEPPAEIVDRTKRVFHPHTGSWKVWSTVMELKLSDEWKLDAHETQSESAGEDEEDEADDGSNRGSDSSGQDSSDDPDAAEESGDGQDWQDMEEPTEGEHSAPEESEPQLVTPFVMLNPLYYAALLGIEEIVRWLEDQGLDCDCVGGRYGFPLQAAVVGNHEAIVKHLISRGANVNQEGGQFQTALMAAADRSTPEIVKILLDAGADVRASSTKDGTNGSSAGFTALHYAARRGDVDIMKLLLDAGAPIDAQEAGFCALHLACAVGHRAVVEELATRGAGLDLANPNGLRAIDFAIVNGHEDLSCYLIEAGVSVEDTQDPSGDGNMLLQALINMPGTETIMKLIKKGVDIHKTFSYGWTVMHQAAQRATPDALKLLIDAGGDPRISDDDGSTPLTVAILCGRAATVDYLLELAKCSTESFWGSTSPLIAAAETGDMEIVRRLVTFGCAIHTIYEATQYTLYDIAVEKNHPELAKELVEWGCFRSPSDGTETGYSEDRLACVVFSEDKGPIEEYLAKGGDRISKTDLAEALCVASSRGSCEVIELLVQKGASVNTKDASGRTCLHHALAHGHFDAADLLIAKGAKLAVEDSIGSTPIDLAVRGGQRSLGFVKRHMADLSTGINHRPSLLMAVGRLAVGRRNMLRRAVSALQIRKTLVGTWEGHYEYLIWMKGDKDPMSIHVTDFGSPTGHGSDAGSLNSPLEFWNDKEEDTVGEFHFYGFVDPVGVIWFVKLYQDSGWLYRGKLDAAKGVIKGTWGSNRHLWHGTFELRKAGPEAKAEGIDK